MIKLTTENTQNAIAKCKQLKPKVRFIKDRVYSVESANNSNVYHVSFDVRNGEKFGQCECKAANAAWFVPTSSPVQPPTFIGKA